MKKLLMVLFACACTAVFAGMNNLLVTFSTPGPDKYADGKAVLDGECYALVWTAEDGAQTVVLAAPLAKDGKCPPVLFQLDEEQAKQYTNGKWGVYLLDTRDFDGDPTGMTLAGVDEKGATKLVNVKAAVGDAVISSGEAFNTAAAKAAVVPADYDLGNLPKPKVSAIQVLGAKVIVTVQDTVPFLGYTVEVGNAGSVFEVPAGATAVSGNKNESINFVLDKKEGGELIKVTSTPLFK